MNRRINCFFPRYFGHFCVTICFIIQSIFRLEKEAWTETEIAVGTGDSMKKVPTANCALRDRIYSLH